MSSLGGFSLRSNSGPSSGQPHPEQQRQFSYQLRSRKKSVPNVDATPTASGKQHSKAVIRKRKWYQKGYLNLYTFDEVPRYLQDNHDIHTHYRAHYSYSENWISLLHLHNESVSTWIHLLAGIASLALAITAASNGPLFSRLLDLHYHYRHDTSDATIVAVFCALAAFTFKTSAAYHLHLSHSHEAYVLFGCWDYAGISATVAGSSVSVLWYLFECDPEWRVVWLMAVVCANSVGVVGPNFSAWPTAKFRPFRSAIYVASAIVSGAPVFHYVATHGFPALPDPATNATLPMLCISVLMYALGVCVYIARFPESWWPGKFDVWGASHQIWHGFVVAAVAAHLYAVFGLIEWRHMNGRCPIS